MVTLKFSIALVSLLAGATDVSGATTTIPASDPHVSWLGRRSVEGNNVYMDWEGVSATITVANYSFVTVTISDGCQCVHGIEPDSHVH